MSIKDGIEKYGENSEIIAFIHYPPFNRYEKLDLNFIETMKKYNIKNIQLKSLILHRKSVSLPR